MTVLTRARAAYAVSLILCALLLVAMAVPAAAARSAGKGKAKHARATTTAVTEDTDTNDGDTPNNVADDGDNRHPSGKDRSVERGGNGNQGNSASDPDDDGRGPDRSNGGADKPDGPGGADLADQDGNNGCGNDDDFEDDNEGWCGANPKRGGPATAPATEAPAQPDDDSCTPGTVGCDDGEDVDGDEGEDVDGDVGACTPGSVGCDDSDSDDSDDGDLGVDQGECDATVTPDCSPDDEVIVGEAVSPPENEGTTDAIDTDVLSSEGAVEDEASVAGGVLEPVAPRLLGAGVAAGGGIAALGAAAPALAATGAPTVVLGLLALAGLGLGTVLVRRTRHG